MSSPVHSVHFYDRDEALIGRLATIVSSSLEGGGSALIVATEEHRHQLATAIQVSGAELDNVQDRLVMFDAQVTLSRFMVHGRPNRRLFLESVGQLVAKLTDRALNERRGLTAFGEMVALLWADGNKTGALELERLWNDLVQGHAFHLHCAYPRWILKGNANDLTLKAICDEHSSVLGFAKHLHPSAA